MRSVLVLGLLVGCGEAPSLRIEVTHPADATAVIARTTITVYESPAVSCAKVELADLSAAQLAAIEVDEIALGDGAPTEALTMSREGTKVIVARGFDEDGALIAAGCAEHGTVGEGEVQAITTELAATASVSGIGLDPDDPFGIVVTVTDPFVRSLPDRVVSWRVHGSDGAAPFATAGVTVEDSAWVPEAPPCTDDDGLVRVHPVPPSTTGGFATEVRAAWATEPPRVFTTFTQFNPSGLTRQPMTDGTTISQRRCALRIAGAVRRLVCLEDRGGPTAVDYTIDTTGGRVTATESATTTQFGTAGNEVPLNVFAIDRGATTRDVYALTTRGRVVGLFSPSRSADSAPRLVTATATDVAVLPACGSTPAALLVRVEAVTGKELRTLALGTGSLGAGQALEPYPAPSVGPTEGLAINATGCVAELVDGGTPIVRQVGVVDVTGRAGPGLRNVTTGFFACETGMCTLPFPVVRAGVGFLPVDPTHPERLVSATFDASGTVLSVGVLKADLTGKPRLVEQERITSAAFPQHLVAGNFDGDGLPDLFWDLGNLNTATTNFQLSYAHVVLGQRLAALSGSIADLIVVDTFVADVDGDGHDDLVVTAQDKLVSPTTHRVIVLPSQVPVPAITLTPDVACGAP